MSASKALIVEDDHFKLEVLEEALSDVWPEASCTVAQSVQQAVQCLRADEFAVIVLDIALPSHESRPGGAQPISQLSGGVEALLELSYEGRSDPVIIVTQYPEIEYDGVLYPLAKFVEATADSLAANIVGVIHFDPREPSWEQEFRRALQDASG